MDTAQMLQRGMQQNDLPPIEIDLSIEAIDKEYSVAGNYFYVMEAPDQTSYIQVKVNSTGSVAKNWKKQTGFKRPFNKLYITTPAGQAGTMTIYIASLATDLYDIIDHRSAISESMQDVVDELRGITAAGDYDTELEIGVTDSVVLAANSDRKGGIIQAKSTNIGIIYLGFSDAVTTSKWFAELQPGMSWPIDDYRGPIYAISDTAAQKLGVGEW